MEEGGREEIGLGLTGAVCALRMGKEEVRKGESKAKP